MYALLLLGFCVWMYFRIARKYKFFEERNIPFVKPTFLLGNGAPVLLKKADILQHIKAMYYTHPNARVVGLFDFVKPVMMIRDPDTIKRIAVKDFDNFSDHTPVFTRAEVEDIGGGSLFGNSLIMLRGQKWRQMRATLSPAFTGSKMRQMFELVMDCAQSTGQFLLEEAKTGGAMEYDMSDVFKRFSNDVIASVAFGIKVDSLREKECDFYVKGKDLLDTRNLVTFAKIMLFRIAPTLMIKLKIDLSSAELTAYFKQMITDNMNQREAHGIVRNDMIDILMQVRKGTLKHQQNEQASDDTGFATTEESAVGKAVSSRVWTENELIAQCFLFFVAGFGTVSTCLTFLSYELLVNPDVQRKLYEEIMAVEKSLNGKPLSYETLQKMQYLDGVISETLRLWPPAPFIDRYCVKDYMYDDGEGLRFKMNKGQIVWFPVIAMHRDPKNFPNPDKFIPERFSAENRASINTAAYMPFGVGPRNCIGSRFALMEVKAIVYQLVKNFTFERSAKSTVPLKLEKTIIGLQTEDGMWLNLKPRAI